MRTIDHILIHCAATPPSSDIGALDIDRWHRQRGWLMNGYHFVIRRDGAVESKAAGFRCRPLEKAGAHVGDCPAEPGKKGWNTRSIGICMAGGIDNEGKPEDNFTDAQYASLKETVEFLRKTFPKTKILGHRDLIKQTKGKHPKACPSFEVSTWLKHVGIEADQR